jgi:hypothetical protein
MKTPFRFVIYQIYEQTEGGNIIPENKGLGKGDSGIKDGKYKKLKPRQF